ncbi:hypothetical protein FJ208_02060 [Candidatus Gribaldobacteria bacterium]|nr:hypothetical protein [Candidatus Gribaldobacteria bacterium]
MFEKSNFWQSVFALFWYGPQLIFKFGECSDKPKKKKKQKEPIFRTNVQAISAFKTEIRQEKIKQVASFFLPFVKF